MKNSKKGDLNISIQAIVMLVIAIVVLGLILGMIRGWFAKAGTQVSGLLDVEDIKTHADANIPFRVPSEVQVKTGDSTDIKVAYYNKGSIPVTNVTITLKSCLDVLTGAQATTKPNLVSIPASKVDPATEQGFRVILNTNVEGGTIKVPFGEYLCSMAAISESGELESVTFTLKVTQ
jgi:hypothetical protein